MCEALHKTSRSLLLSLRALRISAVSALKGFAQKVFAGTVAASPPRCAAGRCLAAGSGFAPRFLDQRSNEGRSPNEEKTFSARQSRASHHGGEAAENRLFVQSDADAKEIDRGNYLTQVSSNHRESISGLTLRWRHRGNPARLAQTCLPRCKNGCQSRQPLANRNGRDGEIRTRDLTHPKRARYQAAPRPVSLT